jgi:hypothetical protein
MAVQAHREWRKERQMLNLTRFGLLVALLAAGCTDDAADPFLGDWKYSTGEFRIDCGGQAMQFPLDGSLVETFAAGAESDLAKSDTMGCAGITFEVVGRVARLAPSPQSCTIPGMGTSTAESYTFTLGDDDHTLIAASSGSFLAPGAPGACVFTGGGTLVKQ